MNDRSNDQPTDHRGLTAFMIKRTLLALVLIAAVLYGLAAGLKYFKSGFKSAGAPKLAVVEPSAPAAPAQSSESHPPTPAREPAAPVPSQPAERGGHAADTAAPAAPAARSEHGAAPPAPSPTLLPAGVAFVDAVINPLGFELNRRFWGWRPNDILNVTDNINNLQLGMLEATRRTVVALAERISRTGYNDAFDRDLENAMNGLMIKPTSYWFPSPETKYKESLSELESYKQRLITREASFHTRADNLIPLLSAYEELLGSCDQNLVKIKEGDGSKVGFTRVDDYFYYAKGVSSTMASVLDAVSRDFTTVLSTRNAAELLHHAIVSCRLAASLDPWVVFNGSLDGVLANHRANMAAPISHARFYLGQLIRTLTT